MLDTMPEPMPSVVELMQPTLARQPFSNAAWLFEPKWDGWRAVCYLHEGKVRFVSKNKRPSVVPFAQRPTLILNTLGVWPDG
ncbi:MAG: hypothetical protein ABR568_22930 [Pyrinomonadaceae bacterium]